jgi:hypothetical protein
VNNRYRQRAPGVAALAVAALGLALATGCSDERKAQVSGTVTLDGVPVENGTIQLYPVGASGQSAGGGIENGKYKLDASVGEMKVTINASKVVGKQKMYDTADSPVIDKMAEIIPDEYNTKSTLTVTLKPGVNEGVNFDLKTKAKTK